MLDIKRIRMETAAVKAALAKRPGEFGPVIDEILAIDEERRIISAKTDDLKAGQNKASKSIPQLKKEGRDTTELMADLKVLSDEIKANDSQISLLEARQKSLLQGIPNTPDDSVPEGKDETDNVEVNRGGKPRAFGFTPLPHWDLGAALGILDPERAAKVTGTRFHFVKGDGSRLERAILNFYLDQHGKNGYTEITPPYLVNRDSMTGTGQLPKFEDDAFKLTDPDYFLVPTAEVPVTNYYRDEILDGKDLPIKFCSFSACFRKEAGSAGRDTRGLIRQHQFMKVEMVKFASPETSFDELESMTANAEHLLELLGLPYRTILLCGGDIGFSAAKTYDVEVWMPSYDRYVEISSCSNTIDFQARRASIRFKNDNKDKARFVHTLNGSGLPIGRTLAAILENFQNEDGTVTVPEVLRPYMGKDRIEPCRK